MMITDRQSPSARFGDQLGISLGSPGRRSASVLGSDAGAWFRCAGATRSEVVRCGLSLPSPSSRYGFSPALCACDVAVASCQLASLGVALDRDGVQVGMYADREVRVAAR